MLLYAQAVQYLGAAGDHECVCYDYRTVEAFGGGQVQDCQYPLGRLSALDSLGVSDFVCGTSPGWAYSHVCCDTCSRWKCDVVKQDQKSYADAVQLPSQWATWSSQYPADMSHNYRKSDVETPVQQNKDTQAEQMQSNPPPAANPEPALKPDADIATPSSSEPTNEAKSDSASDTKTSTASPSRSENTESITKDDSASSGQAEEQNANSEESSTESNIKSKRPPGSPPDHAQSSVQLKPASSTTLSDVSYSVVSSNMVMQDSSTATTNASSGRIPILLFGACLAVTIFV